VPRRHREDRGEIDRPFTWSEHRGPSRFRASVSIFRTIDLFKRGVNAKRR
jgi:hypothetical protein